MCLKTIKQNCYKMSYFINTNKIVMTLAQMLKQLYSCLVDKLSVSRIKSVNRINNRIKTKLCNKPKNKN